MRYDLNRSLKRRESTRWVAFAYEAHGHTWTCLRDAIPFVVDLLGIRATGMKRSDITIACMERLIDQGHVMPTAYVAPWLRGDRPPILVEPRKGRGDRISAFYDTWEWKRLRYEHLARNPRVCACCGATSRLHVDHIKPVRKHWELRLDPGNLQILCQDCNMGKGSRDETDFRPQVA